MGVEKSEMGPRKDLRLMAGGLLLAGRQNLREVRESRSGGE